MNTVLVLRLAMVGLALAAERGEPGAPGTKSALTEESAKKQLKGGAQSDDLRSMLDTKIDLKFDRTPIPDVLAAIRAKTGVNFILDTRQLMIKSVKLAELPVTIDVADITVRSAMNLILRDRALAWVCRDEAILVTTIAGVATILDLRVYPVGDLVVRVEGEWPYVPYLGNMRIDSMGPGQDVDDLIGMITATIAPRTWTAVGGAGAIEFLPAALAIAVRQTNETLDEIEALLEKLREARKLQRPAYAQAKSGELLVASYAAPRRQVGSSGSPPFDANQQRFEAGLKTSLAHAAATAKAFAAVIPQVIEPASWKAAGGKGEIFVVNDRLVIRQTAAVQRQIKTLLSDNPPPAQAPSPPPQAPIVPVRGGGSF